METIINHDGELCFHQNFVTPELAKNLLNVLLNNLDWAEESINMFGKNILVPRLICWYEIKRQSIATLELNTHHFHGLNH